ncbi:hypothetical protein FQN54_006651 [Arachnomyces sp. PD_36]|nr:hypothetical protein FQN54_006651 [Arachnomyces sp. PD_36]
MDNRRSFIIFLVIFFIVYYRYIAPDPHPPSPPHEREYRRKAAEEARGLRLLNTSVYGELSSQDGKWLPLAGLRKSDGFAWGLLPLAQAKARNQFRYALDSAGFEAPDPEPLNPGLDDPTSGINITDYILPVYHNVTGLVRGDWVRSSLPENADRPHLNFTSMVKDNDYISREFAHNITGNRGTLLLKFHEEDGETIYTGGSFAREVKAEMVVESVHGLGKIWRSLLFGVHYPESGEIVLSTTSEKFSGLFSLPHFSLSADTFELSRQLLNQSLSDAMAKLKKRLETFLPWSLLPHDSDTVSFPTPKCEYIVYIHQHPVSIGKNLASNPLLSMIEDELRFPVGAPIPTPPPMTMSAVVFSPDCGFIIETEGAADYAPSAGLHLTGPKQEVYRTYASRFAMMIIAIMTFQVAVAMRQMKEASTPSTMSRISYYTIAIMSLGDGFLISFTNLELYWDTPFPLLMVIGFLGVFSISYLGMKFQFEIQLVQAPERQEGRQAEERNAARDTLPAPATASGPRDTGATPVVIPSDQDTTEQPEPPATRATTLREGGTSSALRFCLILVGLLIFSSLTLHLPRRLGAIYANILSFLYLSFWTPQIYRNIMRNCRKALLWEFVVGESILRLFPIVYLYTVPGNVLFIGTDYTAALALVGWVWIQCCALASQDILGPRFFVPNGWAPPAYDYHPILRDTSAISGSGEDIEPGDTMPIGFLRSEEREPPAGDLREREKSRPTGRGKRKIFDCAICMQDIEVPVASSPSGGSAGGGGGGGVTEEASNLLGRRAYMVTPCRHIFHSGCLESWMRFRLQCPICRENIPPV